MSGSRLTRSTLVGALSAGFLVVVFCLLLLWQNPLVFWNDDYELSVLPVFADMARSWSEGHWPILSPYSWVCGNLAGEFQYRHIFGFRECGCRSDLEIPADFSATGRCTFNRTSFCSGDWRILTRARSRLFTSSVDFCSAGCLTKRLDYLLGCDRLVRRSRRVHLAAMGMVGSRTGAGPATDEMAVPLARSIRVSARHGRISGTRF